MNDEITPTEKEVEEKYNEYLKAKQKIEELKKVEEEKLRENKWVIMCTYSRGQNYCSSTKVIGPYKSSQEAHEKVDFFQRNFKPYCKHRTYQITHLLNHPSQKE